MSEAVFTGTVPDVYGRVLVPMLFQPYAVELAGRLAALDPPPAQVLEVAAGTGVLTRELARQLPAARVLATDLSPGMLATAAAAGTPTGVEWQQADAQTLPAADGAFDAVVCQFGIMFVPDRVQAYREARRVLAPGGRLLLALWTGVETNDFARVVDDALVAQYPGWAPGFLRRVPHGHGDPAVIERELRAAGFGTVQVDVVERTSRAASAIELTRGFLCGTPTGAAVPGGRVDDADTAAIEAAVRERFGDGEVSGVMTALVVTATG